MRTPRVLLGLLLVLPFALKSAAADAAAVDQGIRRSKWNGFDRLDFTFASRACILVVPANAAPGKPWIWRTEFFDHEPQADIALVNRGWHLAYIDAKNMYGGPAAMALFGQFYAHVVTYAGVSPRVVMEGFSRGGLYAVNFAASHPTRVAALYLDAPVLDIRSWPGRNPASKEWAECLAAYNLTEQSVAQSRGSPIDRVRFVAGARIPIIAVCGDADKTVPLAENMGAFEKRYRELGGGPIEVILKPGGDHHPHSLQDPTPIVDFLVKNAKF